MHDTSAVEDATAATRAIAPPQRSQSAGPVLVILHQERSTAGHIGRMLCNEGVALDVRRPRFDEPLPATLRDHAGVVVFGGPMSANDRDGFIRREIALVELALKEQRPYLGLCLGAQLMAAALGARVSPHPQAHVEIGYHPLKPLPPATRIGGQWPRVVYQWHKEGFDLPRGAELLAMGHGSFVNQAIGYGGTAFGLQFHPEVTYQMASRWSGRNEYRLHLLRGAQRRSPQLLDHIHHGPNVRSWLARFLHDWLALGRDRR